VNTFAPLSAGFSHDLHGCTSSLVFRRRVGRRGSEEYVEITLALLQFNGFVPLVLVYADQDGDLSPATGENVCLSGAGAVGQFGEFAARFSKIDCYVHLVQSFLFTLYNYFGSTSRRPDTKTTPRQNVR